MNTITRLFQTRDFPDSKAKKDSRGNSKNEQGCEDLSQSNPCSCLPQEEREDSRDFRAVLVNGTGKKNKSITENVPKGSSKDRGFQSK